MAYVTGPVVYVRPSQDLDFATGDHKPLPDIAEHVRQALICAPQ